MEADVLGSREASRARRTAIHARGADRVIKCAVCGGIASRDSSPAGVVYRCCGELYIVRRSIHSAFLVMIYQGVNLSAAVDLCTQSLAFEFGLSVLSDIRTRVRVIVVR